MDSANTRSITEEAEAGFSIPEPVPSLEPVPGNLTTALPVPDDDADPTDTPIVSGHDPEPPNHASITRLAYEIWISGGQQVETDKADWRSAEIILWTEYVHTIDSCHSMPGRVSFGKITS